MRTDTCTPHTAYRKGEYFDFALPTPNSSGSDPWYGTVTVSSTFSPGQSTNGTLFVPHTPEHFTHDDDGNLTQDGHWSYTWDAENRLIRMETISSVPEGAKMALVFTNDFMGRRIRKTVSNWVSGAWALVSDHRFLYDGWNLLAILNPQSSILQSFTWGTDLSGTMQGAGGVGGLLAVWDSSTLNNQPSTHFAAYDGNGNVSALVNASDGTSAAQYEYGPFGEAIRATGPMAKASPFRFSTKYQDDETDLLYYGYRYYNASTGRWISRDPIEDITYFSSVQWLSRVGLVSQLPVTANTRNLYHFAFNDGVNAVDFLGLDMSPPKEGDPCCAWNWAGPCKVRANFVRVSVAPVWTSGGGCSGPTVTSWTITVRVDYSTEGDCYILGCKYWTCNTRRPRGTPSAYTSGSCDGWTYNVGGPISDNFHAKAMEGVIEYLSCESGRYVKKQLSAGSLQQGFYYQPPEVWSGGNRVYP